MTSEATWSAIDRFLSVSSAGPHLEMCVQAICGADVDWVAIIAEANRHFVAPALWSTLREPQLCARLPADVREYLCLLYLQNARRNSRIRQQCIEIGAILSRANICVVLLKGATWLFDANRPAAADRMMLDVDLLVARSDVESAINALIAAGYRKMGDFAEIGYFHQLPLLPPEGEVCVKIHRDLSESLHLLRAGVIIDAASQVAPGVLMPALRHRILHNVVHAQIENGDRAGGVLNLRDTLDLARLMTRCGPEFDWIALADEARESGFYAIFSGAIHCAHRVFESPVPNPFIEHLGGRMHAWRCIQQRRWGRLGKMMGSLDSSGALAREREHLQRIDRRCVPEQASSNRT